MGQTVTSHDYYHSFTDEPHATRRKEMLSKWNRSTVRRTVTSLTGFLEKYPEIKQLMGHDWRMGIQVAICVLVQITVAILMRQCSWWTILGIAYVVGGTINHSLSLALHELTHNLAFGHSRPMCNRMLGFFANLPLGVPAAITFKKYHLDHHRWERLNDWKMKSLLLLLLLDFKVIKSTIRMFQHVSKSFFSPLVWAKSSF